MRRSRYQLPDNKNQSFTLNITSMTDMFTILLVFLLQSYAATTVPIDTPESMKLPISNSEKNPVHAVKLALSQKGLIFETEKIASLQEIQNNSKAAGDELIEPLLARLQKVDKKQAADGLLMLQADQATPYSTLKKVLYTASVAGFTNIKLVTVVGL